MTSQTDEKWFDPSSTTFGDRLAGAREDAGMTQDQLARRIGVKIKSLERWENDHTFPRANHLSMLAGLLNVSILWLLSGEGPGPSAPSEVADPQANLNDLLREVSVLRGLMDAAAERMTRLETRLESAIDRA